MRRGCHLATLLRPETNPTPLQRLCCFLFSSTYDLANLLNDFHRGLSRYLVYRKRYGQVDFKAAPSTVSATRQGRDTTEPKLVHNHIIPPSPLQLDDGDRPDSQMARQLAGGHR